MIKKSIIILFSISIAVPSPRVKSLLLPGWGEISLGNKSSAQKLMAMEMVLWLMLIKGKNLSENYKQEYRAFASQHANVNWEFSDNLYAIDLAYYDNIDQYNLEKSQQRSLPIELDENGELNRKYGHAIYPLNGNFDWSWNDTENRILYNELRISSASWEKYSNFAIAGLLINRIISVINIIYFENSLITTSFNSQINRQGISEAQFKLIFNY